jgi:hypothetical protein
MMVKSRVLRVSMRRCSIVLGVVEDFIVLELMITGFSEYIARRDKGNVINTDP